MTRKELVVPRPPQIVRPLLTRLAGGGVDRVPKAAFRLVSLLMALEDFLHPTVPRRVRGFGIETGMTVVDYGCGPARYTLSFSQLVGPSGQVFAVDVQELAIETVQRKIQAHALRNVTAVLAAAYDTRLDSHIADVVCALDVLYGVSDPTGFLREAHRLTKSAGRLIIDSKNQSRATTVTKIEASGCWKIHTETGDHFVCTPA